MARFNEILVGRYNRAIQKLFSMKGSAPAPQLASEISTAFVFFYGAENRYLEGWERFGISVTVGASPANIACHRIRNPGGSNVVAVLEKIEIGSSSTDTPQLVHGTTIVDLGTVQPLTNSNFDSRGRPTPTCIVSSQASAAAAPAMTNQRSIAQPNLSAVSNYDIINTDICEIPLLPGDGYQVQSITVNLQLLVSFWWRERFLEDSERT
jgi:hypothetical protein